VTVQLVETKRAVIDKTAVMYLKN